MADNRVISATRDAELLWSRMSSQLRCAMPGTIVSFDSVKQTCSVQPGLPLKVTDGETVSYVALPVIVEVPCVLPRSNGFAITLPIVIGDPCLLVFSDRDIDNFLLHGKYVAKNADKDDDVRQTRQHALTDAICIPGLSTTPNVLSNYSTDALELRTADRSTVLRISTSGIEITTTGTFKVNNLNIMTHRHTSASSGSPTSVPIP